MRRKINLEGDYEFFSGKRIGNILLLGLKQNLMLQLTNMVAKTMFFDYLDRISESDSLKVVVIWGSPGKRDAMNIRNFTPRSSSRYWMSVRCIRCSTPSISSS